MDTKRLVTLRRYISIKINETKADETVFAFSASHASSLASFFVPSFIIWVQEKIENESR